MERARVRAESSRASQSYRERSGAARPGETWDSPEAGAGEDRPGAREGRASSQDDSQIGVWALWDGGVCLLGRPGGSGFCQERSEFSKASQTR